MPRIDINSPSPDEDFDITDDTITGEANPPEVEAKPFSDFSEAKPEVSPFGPSAESESESEAVTETPAPAPTEAAVTAAPTVQETPAESKPTVGSRLGRRSFARVAIEALLAVLVVGLALWGWSLKTDNSNLSKQVNDLGKQVTSLQSNPLLVAEGKQNKILAAVGRLTVLPTGVIPTISEVTDANAVKKSVPDLKDVQNGDMILFYLKSGQIIQYRPSTDKVVLNQRFTVNK